MDISNADLWWKSDPGESDPAKRNKALEKCPKK